MTSWCAGKRCCSSLGPVCWLCWCTQISVSAKSFLVAAPTLTFSTERAKGAYAAAAASYWDYARASDEKRKISSTGHSQAQHAQQAAVEDARISVQLFLQLFQSVRPLLSLSVSQFGRTTRRKKRKRRRSAMSLAARKLEFFDSAGMVVGMFSGGQSSSSSPHDGRYRCEAGSAPISPLSQVLLILAKRRRSPSRSSAAEAQQRAALCRCRSQSQAAAQWAEMWRSWQGGAAPSGSPPAQGEARALHRVCRGARPV